MTHKTLDIHTPQPAFEIVAHRGATADCPENTIPAFERAVEIGADWIELDVRLTKDRIPVIYHYYYLHEITGLAGPIFERTLEEIQKASLLVGDRPFRIPTLREVLNALGSKIGYEIEIKGPEPEAPEIIGEVLSEFKSLWGRMEITSFEPALLLEFQHHCPGIVVDLLFPKSEPWMQRDVIAYAAAHRARLAKTRAVHLHPTQLSAKVVETVRQHGLEVHMWDANDTAALKLAVELEIPNICTDQLRQAINFRKRLQPKERVH